MREGNTTCVLYVKGVYRCPPVRRADIATERSVVSDATTDSGLKTAQK